MKFKPVDADVDTFEHDYYTYTKDFKLKCYLEKLFDSKYQAVWTTEAVKVEGKECNWSCRNIVILKSNGKFIMLNNSEWAYFTELN